MSNLLLKSYTTSKIARNKVLELDRTLAEKIQGGKCGCADGYKVTKTTTENVVEYSVDPE